MCTRHGFVVVLIEVQSAVGYRHSLKKTETYFAIHSEWRKGKWLGENASVVQYWPLLWRVSFDIMVSDWNIAFGFGSFYFVVRPEAKIQNNKPSNDATHTEWVSRAETLSRAENRWKNATYVTRKFPHRNVFFYWVIEYGWCVS